MATVTGDPHLRGAHGDLADFRGGELNLLDPLLEDVGSWLVGPPRLLDAAKQSDRPVALCGLSCQPAARRLHTHEAPAPWELDRPAASPANRRQHVFDGRCEDLAAAQGAKRSRRAMAHACRNHVGRPQPGPTAHESPQAAPPPQPRSWAAVVAA
eukprot:6152959-Prymnesium_polylepis.1